MSRHRPNLIKLVVLWSLMSAASASAQSSVYHSRGTIARMFGGQNLPDCVEWRFALGGAEASIKSEPGAPERLNVVSLFLTIVDRCNRQRTVVEIAVDGAAQLNASLDSATLAFDSPVRAQTCTGRPGSPPTCTFVDSHVTASVTFTGSGPVARSRNTYVEQHDGSTLRERVSGEIREATVVGSITFNDQSFTLTGDTVSSAQLLKNAQSDITTTHR